MFKKIIIIFISLIIAVVAFEFFLNYSPFGYGTSPVKYDAQIGMWHKKDYRGYTTTECYQTNYKFDNAGLPSSMYKYNKSNKDVILLGDSFTEAIMVKNKNIMHNSLAQVFNQKYNFKNYGLSGSSPTQQFIILKDKVDLENTKYVLQFIGLEGDLMDVDSKNLSALARPKVYVEFDTLDNYKIIPPRSKNLFDTIGDLLGDYEIYSFIKKLLYHIKDSIQNKKSDPLDTPSSKSNLPDLSKNWLYLEGAIHQINKYINSLDSKIQYKIIVTSDNIDNQDRIKKFLISENIDFIFLNDMAKKMNIKLKTFPCDGHWVDETHKDIAKIIKKSKLID